MREKFNANDFLNRLERLREEHGLSKGEFCQRVGIKNLFSRYKPAKKGQTSRKIKEPKEETLEKIAREFNVSVEFLRGAEDVKYEMIINDTPVIAEPPTQPIGFGEAVELLKKIYDSGDAPRINAICHNLVQFAADADLRAKIDQQNHNDIETKMDRRFADFEKVMEKKYKEILDAIVGKAAYPPQKAANDGGT